MTDFISLAQIAGTVLLIALPITVLSRALAGTDGPSLAHILAIPVDPPLPRGVQEGEPVRFKVERLSRPRTASPAGAREREGLARPGRPAVEAGPCATC